MFTQKKSNYRELSLRKRYNMGEQWYTHRSSSERRRVPCKPENPMTLRERIDYECKSQNLTVKSFYSKFGSLNSMAKYLDTSPDYLSKVLKSMGFSTSVKFRIENSEISLEMLMIRYHGKLEDVANYLEISLSSLKRYLATSSVCRNLISKILSQSGVTLTEFVKMYNGDYTRCSKILCVPKNYIINLCRESNIKKLAIAS